MTFYKDIEKLIQAYDQQVQSSINEIRNNLLEIKFNDNEENLESAKIAAAKLFLLKEHKIDRDKTGTEQIKDYKQFLENVYNPPSKSVVKNPYFTHAALVLLGDFEAKEDWKTYDD